MKYGTTINSGDSVVSVLKSIIYTDLPTKPKYLYNSGDQYFNTTAGWESVGDPYYQGKSVMTGGLAFNTNSMVYQDLYDGIYAGSIISHNDIDITGYSYLKMSMKTLLYGAGSDTIYLFCYTPGSTTTIQGISEDNGGSYISATAYSGNWCDISLILDIRNLSGYKRIGVMIAQTAANHYCTAYISSVYLDIKYD